jgi:plastocyanin
MRTTLVLVALALASLALGRADEHNQKTMPAAPIPMPGAKLERGSPPTTAFRSRFFFPDSVKPKQKSEVTLYDNYFSPSVLWVAAGTEVRFTNQGQHHHTTTCNWVWESGDLAPGKSFSLTFSRSGNYSYYCRHHTSWMRGTVTVY